MPLVRLDPDVKFDATREVLIGPQRGVSCLESSGEHSKRCADSPQVTFQASLMVSVFHDKLISFHDFAADDMGALVWDMDWDMSEIFRFRMECTNLICGLVNDYVATSASFDLHRDGGILQVIKLLFSTSLQGFIHEHLSQ